MIKRSIAALLVIFSSASAEAQECHPGVAHLARGNFAAALETLRTASRNDGSNASLLNSRGVAELLNDRIAESIATFSRVLELDGRFHEAYFNRGIAHLRRGDYARAGADFEQAFASGDAALRARAAYHLALASDGAKRPDDAMKWIDQALAADPSLPEAKLYRGVLLERNRKFREAGEAYRDYLAHEPKSLVAMLRFGIVAHRAGYPATAIKYLRIVVERAPDSLEAVEARKFLVMWE